MESCGTGTCLCSGGTVEDTNKSVLLESTVDFYKVKQEEGTHYCFEGIYLQQEEILHNIQIGQTLLQSNDHLVVSSNKSLIPFLELNDEYIAKECFLEDKIFYTVITC